MTKIIRPGTMKIGNRRASVYCKVTLEHGTLSISGVEGPLPSGNCLGLCGQIIMSLNPNEITPSGKWNMKMVYKLFRFWKEWHLNDMRAGCKHQIKGDYGDPAISSQYCEVCKYKYGTAWIKEPLPQDVINFFRRLPLSDKKPSWV